MRIYLGGSMFTQADIINNLRLTKRLRNEGFCVYCPNENDSINDKTRTDISSVKIYTADITELENSNIFLCQFSEDSGTMWEAGYMDALHKYKDSRKYLGVIGLATDIRLRTLPDINNIGVDNQAMYLNQFVVGGLKCSLGIFTDETQMIEKLLMIKKGFQDNEDCTNL